MMPSPPPCPYCQRTMEEYKVTRSVERANRKSYFGAVYWMCPYEIGTDESEPFYFEDAACAVENRRRAEAEWLEDYGVPLPPGRPARPEVRPEVFSRPLRGMPGTLACDGKCNKAWGINQRPKVWLSTDIDDSVELADDELGEAPVDPGTYEGGCGKPENAESGADMNKWCARECERSEHIEPKKPVVVRDLSVRRPNITKRDKSPEGFASDPNHGKRVRVPVDSRYYEANFLEGTYIGTFGEGGGGNTILQVDGEPGHRSVCPKGDLVWL
jgi:hypothetical protein